MTFKLNSDYIELDKLLKITGLVLTGGQAGLLIRSGQVKVDGQVEKRKDSKIRKGQKISFNQQEVTLT